MNTLISYLKFIGITIQTHPLVHYTLALIFAGLLILLVGGFTKRKDVMPLHKIQKKYMDANNELADIAGDDVYATQLDLAKAYMEMGHKDAAKKLLIEARQEGNSAQQKEARRLLETI
jgi:FimV-like protein